MLDVGCGTGRVGEAVVAAGARPYVAVDVSPRMVRLTSMRVPEAEVVRADFLTLELARTFDVVLALGVFEYVDDAPRAAEWLRARCASTLVASFTRWDWLKGPLRHVHYELIHRLPVREYTEERVEELLGRAGFSTVGYPFRGRRGFVVTAS